MSSSSTRPAPVASGSPLRTVVELRFYNIREIDGEQEKRYFADVWKTMKPDYTSGIERTRLRYDVTWDGQWRDYRDGADSQVTLSSSSNGWDSKTVEACVRAIEELLPSRWYCFRSSIAYTRDQTGCVGQMRICLGLPAHVIFATPGPGCKTSRAIRNEMMSKDSESQKASSDMDKLTVKPMGEFVWCFMDPLWFYPGEAGRKAHNYLRSVQLQGRGAAG